MKNFRTNQRGRSLNSLLYHTSLLALMMTCFTFYASHSYAQGATGANLVKNTVIENVKMMPVGCPDDAVLTNIYCDSGCNGTPGGCNGGGAPTSGGVFLCVSNDANQSSAQCNGSVDCDARNCKFVHIRNETTCGDYIDQITFTITKDANSGSFVVCSPLTQFGANQGSGCDWSPKWNIAESTTQLFSQVCNSWTGGSGLTTRTITFTLPNTGTAPNFRVMPCYHWTVIVCGANITNVQLHWANGGSARPNTNFANPTVNTSPCPDAGSSYHWCDR